jgi:hypothetical protein
MPLQVAAMVETNNRLMAVTKGVMVALVATTEATIVLVGLTILIMIINARSVGS